MNSRFDELWTLAADDGASCLAGVTMTRAEADDEVDHRQLLDAWYRERQDHIECSLVLGRALRWICHLLADGEITPRRRRQAGRLIQAIHELQEREDDGRHP
jgi:hypothetical protein